MELIRFIKNNKDWEERLKDMSVRVKSDGELYIFNYLPGADFFNPVVRECRGVILDGDLNIICRGFDKFGNYSEPYAADIDWGSAKVQQKIDGSIVKCYWYDGKWNWSTNSTIYAENASVPSGEVKNFQELIDMADNKPNVSEFDKEYTYIFELVSPYSQVVIRYPRTHLYHIGTRKNDIFGEEINVIIKGVEKPKEYQLNSLNACVEAVKTLNHGEVEEEGFVVVDKCCNRIKIKAEEYFELHKTRFFTITAEKAITLIRETDFGEIVKDYPEYDVEFSWYLYQYRLFLRKKREMEVYATNLMEEYEGNRKLVAMKIKDEPYSYFGFKAIDGKTVAEEDIGYDKIKQFIVEFGES